MRRLAWPLYAAGIAVLLQAAAAGAQESGGDEALDPEAEAFLAGTEGEAGAEAGADGTGGGAETPASGEAEGDAEAEAFLAGTEQPEIEAPEEEEGVGWEEPDDMRFWMVGVRYRTIFVPGWLLNLFFDFPQWQEDQASGPFFANHAAGVEFTTRRNDFSIIGAVWWAGYFSSEVGVSSSPEWFIASEENKTNDPEFIESSLSVLIFSVDFVYSTMFTDWFGITYGGGLGLGVVFGDVVRHEAFVDPLTGEHERCIDEGNPDAAFCEGRGGDDDGYYGMRDDRVPPVIPWVNLLVGLRFKPMRHLEINLDGGVGVGFVLGARVNYIF